MQIWGIVAPDNTLKMWLGTWRNRFFRRFPRIKKNGMVTLDGWPYVVDSQRFLRRKIAKIGGREKENLYQFWLQNEPDPITFDKTMTPGSIGITSEKISLYAKSEHLRRLVQPEKDWILYIIIAVIVGIAGAGIGYSLGLQTGINGGR